MEQKPVAIYVDKEIVPSEKAKVAVNVTPLTIELFKRYFNLIGNIQEKSEDQWKEFLVQHGQVIQENALKGIHEFAVFIFLVFAYRCIQEGRFMTSRLRTNPHYKDLFPTKVYFARKLTIF